MLKLLSIKCFDLKKIINKFMFYFLILFLITIIFNNIFLKINFSEILKDIFVRNNISRP